jgi:hypothetical protein
MSRASLLRRLAKLEARASMHRTMFIVQNIVRGDGSVESSDCALAKREIWERKSEESESEFQDRVLADLWERNKSAFAISAIFGSAKTILPLVSKRQPPSSGSDLSRPPS